MEKIVIMKIAICFCALFFSTLTYANSFKERVKDELGSCVELPNNLAKCKPSACVMPYKEREGGWYTTIIRGKMNDKCYVLSYAFLDSEIISDVEHCYYDKDSLNKAFSYALSWVKADSAFTLSDVKKNWTNLKYKVCKVVSNKK